MLGASADGDMQLLTRRLERLKANGSNDLSHLLVESCVTWFLSRSARCEPYSIENKPEGRTLNRRIIFRERKIGSGFNNNHRVIFLCTAGHISSVETLFVVYYGSK